MLENVHQRCFWPCLKQRKKRLEHIDGAPEVDRHHSLDLLDRQIADGHEAADDPGDVDQSVDRGVIRCHDRREGLNRGPVGDVEDVGGEPSLHRTGKRRGLRQAGSLRSTAAIRAPRPSSSRAASRPIPFPPPVTTKTLLRTRIPSAVRESSRTGERPLSLPLRRKPAKTTA
jgi:hypothetical protein